MAEANPTDPQKDAKPADAGNAAVPPPAANDNPPLPEKPAAVLPMAFNARAMVAESAEASAYPRKVSFTARNILIEGREASVYPRPDIKDNGFEKMLRFFGLGDFVDARRQPKNKGHLLGQAVATKIGFGDIFRAARQPHNKIRGTLKAIGTKIADMAAGRMVSGSFKLIAITFVAGMLGGVTGWGSIFLIGLATGASSAIYSYGKNYVTDKLSLPKSQRSKVKILDKTRALDALKAFGSGFFNGAFGVWLANLPIFKSTMKFLHGLIHQGIGQISKPFSIEDGTSNFNAFRRSISSDFTAAARPSVATTIAASAPRSAPGPSLG